MCIRDRFKDTQYLSSGELNEQLAGGAYADVLISASKAKMDEAVDGGYVDEASRFDMSVSYTHLC